MKIKVDQDKCIGCGTCEALCPGCFEVIEGKSQVKECDSGCGDYDLKEVAESCPTDAISIEE